jgi:hypothetical protein
MHYIALLKGSSSRPIVAKKCYLPVWNTAQPKVIEKLWLTSATLPVRTNAYLAEEVVTADSLVREAIAKTDALFVSPIEEFCDSSGCQLAVSLDPLVPVAWDSAHLTREASQRLIFSASDKILGQPPRDATQPPIS